MRARVGLSLWELALGGLFLGLMWIAGNALAVWQWGTMP